MKLVKVKVNYVDVDAITNDIVNKVNVLGDIATITADANLSADIIGTLCAISDNLSEITNKISNK